MVGFTDLQAAARRLLFAFGAQVEARTRRGGILHELRGLEDLPHELLERLRDLDVVLRARLKELNPVLSREFLPLEAARAGRVRRAHVARGRAWRGCGCGAGATRRTSSVETFRDSTSHLFATRILFTLMSACCGPLRSHACVRDSRGKRKRPCARTHLLDLRDPIPNRIERR